MNKKSEIAKVKLRNANGKFVKKYQSADINLQKGLAGFKSAAHSSFIALPELVPPMPVNPAVTPVAPGVYHVNTYRSIASTTGGIMRNLDEALRASPETAKAMLNDCGLTAPLFLRANKLASFGETVTPDDENDEEQVAVCDSILKEIQAIPRWGDYKRNLAFNAMWYGKTLNYNDFSFEWKDGKRKLVVREHFPIIGDKLIFRNNGRLGYLVHMPTGFRDVIYSDRGMAELFMPEDIDNLVVHKFWGMDTTWDESMLSIGQFGFGIRHMIYWTYWLKQQLLEWALNTFQLFSGAGLRIAYFEQSNPESEQAVANAMAQANGQNIILFPRPIGEESQGAGLEIVSPAGIDLSHFQHFIEDYFQKQIDHFILGYDFDTEREDLYNYHCWDASLLSETITRDLVSVFVKYNHPELNFKPKYEICVPVPHPDKFLESCQRAGELGLTMKASELYARLGFTRPGKKDKIVVKPDAGVGIRSPKSEIGSLEDNLAGAGSAGPEPSLKPEVPDVKSELEATE
jgi:hypothetical protein